MTTVAILLIALQAGEVAALALLARAGVITARRPARKPEAKP